MAWVRSPSHEAGSRVVKYNVFININIEALGAGPESNQPPPLFLSRRGPRRRAYPAQATVTSTQLWSASVSRQGPGLRGGGLESTFGGQKLEAEIKLAEEPDSTMRVGWRGLGAEIMQRQTSCGDMAER